MYKIMTRTAAILALGVGVALRRGKSLWRKPRLRTKPRRRRVQQHSTARAAVVFASAGIVAAACGSTAADIAMAAVVTTAGAATSFQVSPPASSAAPPSAATTTDSAAFRAASSSTAATAARAGPAVAWTTTRAAEPLASDFSDRRLDIRAPISRLNIRRSCVAPCAAIARSPPAAPCITAYGRIPSMAQRPARFPSAVARPPPSRRRARLRPRDLSSPHTVAAPRRCAP